MATPSAEFTVNGSSVTGEIAVAAGSTVTLALISATGAEPIVWSVYSNSAPSLTNPTLTISTDKQTVTFTMPAGQGQAYILQCQVRNGRENGQTVSGYTFRAKIGVNTASGVLPLCAGETTEANATYGWTPKINTRLADVAPTAVSTTLTTSDATPATVATIATSQEYYYVFSVWVTSRQDSSTNESVHHVRFGYTNKGGTLAQLGSDSLDALNVDNITLFAAVAHSANVEDVVIQVAGHSSNTVRHDVLVEYYALPIRTS